MAYATDYTKLHRSKKRGIVTCPVCGENGKQGEDRILGGLYYLHKSEHDLKHKPVACRVTT